MAVQAADNPAKKGKVNNIQALRAFAAVLVVTFHTGYIWPTGFAVGSFGVDVFFVISGYIMARICDGNASFFLRRRLIRIIPPYWALTLLVFALAWKLPRLTGTTRTTPRELFESLFFIPFVKETGIFRPVLFVGWSLNYEMFFYVLIAAALLFSRKQAIWIASASVVAAQVALHQIHPQVPALNFYAAPIMLEFPLGVLAYQAVKLTSLGAAIRMRGVAGVIAAAAAASLMLCQGYHAFLPSMDWLRIALTSFLLVLSSALLSKGGWDTNLGTVILIGDASYVLYLLHPYCLYFIGRLLAPHFKFLNITHLPGALFASLLAILIAVWAHLYLELPTVNYLNLRFGGRRRSTEFKQTA